MKLKQPKFRFERAMLIDDSEIDNFINEKMIESSSFSRKVYVCSNGATALEFLKNILVVSDVISATAPQVIFVDLNMPVMNGFQFIEELIKIKDKLGNPVVVVLTSSVNEEDRKHANALLPEIIFLQKPLRSDMLNALGAENQTA